MMAALREAFEAEPAAEERVTVLRSEGPVFCSGLQLSTSGVDPAEAVNIEGMFTAVQQYPLPVVAVVQGAAIAGGCELALHCDFIVAVETAKFAMPLAQLGVATTWFLTKKIMETMGLVAARELLLLGDFISAKTFHANGHIARAVPASELDAETNKIVQRLAANAPLSMRILKRLLLKQVSFYDELDHSAEDEEVKRVFASEDALEGIAARIENGRPSSRGHSIPFNRRLV